MPLPQSLSGIFKAKNKSYKMTLMLSILRYLDYSTGLASFDDVVDEFIRIYDYYEMQGDIFEQPPRGNCFWRSTKRSQFVNLLETPFDALSSILERKTYNGKVIGFREEVWKEMNPQVIRELRQYALREFYSYMMSKDYPFSLRKLIVDVMDQYPTAKAEARADHPIDSLVRKNIPEELQKLYFVGDTQNTGFIVQGSVGRPAWADVPWIAIMNNKETTTTQKGVYVCYLFAKDMKSVYLVLMQGDSPLKEFGKEQGRLILEEKKVELRELLPLDGFSKEDNVVLTNRGRGVNYTTGIISHKRYDYDSFPDDQEMFADLCNMMWNYQLYLSEDARKAAREPVDELRFIVEYEMPEEGEGGLMIQIEDDQVKEKVQYIQQFIRSRGFSYPDNLIENFYLSLKSKPFVILAGISGTGKTKLVKLFAEAVGATRENGRFTLIPVRPDWSDPSDLIGYTDLSGQFRKGKIAEVLIAASNNRHQPFFICLDEMNLARVEHYFSDLLSIMETQEWTDVGEKNQFNSHLITSFIEDGIEYNLSLPDNVYIIGTVNMDETTHPFSKKVLDRANTIEFNHIDLDNIEEIFGAIQDSSDPIQPLPNSFLRSDYLQLQDAQNHMEVIGEVNSTIVSINHALEKSNSHVGFRVRDAICFFMVYNHRFGLLDKNHAFDIQFSQKILPRLQGSSPTVKQTLIELLGIAINQPNKLKEDDLMNEGTTLYKAVFKREPVTAALYPVSATKIASMIRRYEEDGFTSFWI